MGAFDTIDIGATGADVSQMWLDAIAHNLANVNTVRASDEEPFREHPDRRREPQPTRWP